MVRISGSGRPGGIHHVGKREKKAASSKSASRGDRVRVADAAGLREKAKAMLADLPDVRLERIEEIRDALERGQYHVAGEKVARRIIANALAEHPW